jgi:hypothetical protein
MMWCPHLDEPGFGDKHTKEKMMSLAREERRFTICWGVVHPGNALVHSVHETFADAERERKAHAYAYVTVRVCVTPLYERADDNDQS